MALIGEKTPWSETRITMFNALQSISSLSFCAASALAVRPFEDFSNFPPQLRQIYQERELVIQRYLSDQVFPARNHILSRDLRLMLQEIEAAPASFDRAHRNNDVLARVLLEIQYHDVLQDHYRAGDSRPPYYYSYLQGETLEGEGGQHHLRMVGLLPPRDKLVHGVICYFRGFGCGIEYDPDAVRTILHSGFAVFSMEPVDHGLSSHQNPLTLGSDSSHLNAIHTKQFIQEVESIMASDDRLAGRPKFVLASSVGVLHALAGIVALGGAHNFAGLVLDNPMFELGKRFWKPGWLRLEEEVRNDLESVRVQGTDEHIEYFDFNMAERCIDDPRLSAAQAKGLYDYLESSLGYGIAPLWWTHQRSYQAHTRRALMEAPIVEQLPPTMLIHYPQDVRAGSLANRNFLLALRRPDSVLRTTRYHLNISWDMDVLRDALNFFLGNLSDEGRSDLSVGTSHIAAHLMSSGELSQRELTETDWAAEFQKGSFEPPVNGS